MFGKFGLVKFFLLSFLLVLPAQAVFAQKQTPASVGQQATIITDEAQVYKDPDFDAEVVATLSEGQKFTISNKTKGPFYRIRVKQGLLGWIADTDVLPEKLKKQVKAAEKKIKKQKAPEEDVEDTGPDQEVLLYTPYSGVALEMIQWSESTMGAKRKENLLFYGWEWAGYNTLMDGELYITTAVLLHIGAPNYYGDLTGQSTSGFIVKPHFTFDTVLSETKHRLIYYGFGPTFTYSHFHLGITNAGVHNEYDADDMGLGALFTAGAAFLVKGYSPRVELKYYWEKEQYFGLNVALLGLF